MNRKYTVKKVTNQTEKIKAILEIALICCAIYFKFLCLCKR